MKIIVLISGGRTGIDFFQSLLDGHSEISQFPGCIYYDEFWIKSKNENQLENIAKMFIRDYKFYFDSRLNIAERHNMLGEDMNSFYLVNKDLFIKYFVDLMKNKNLNQNDLLCSLNLAYSQASGEELSKKKIIVLNLHHLHRTKFLSKLDFEIIYSIRNPLANYTSIMRTKKYNIGDFLMILPEKEIINKYKDRKYLVPWTYYFHMNRIFNGLKDAINTQKKIHVIQLETLHTKNVKVMKDFCSIFNITYNESTSQSTYHGKKWWGDKTSGKYLDGVNPNFKNNIDRTFFFKKDIECFETYLKVFLLKYNYPLLSNPSSLKCALLKYLPLKEELGIWKEAFISLNIKQIISIIVNWIKRVNLMSKKIYDNVNFPNPIGTKK